MNGSHVIRDAMDAMDAMNAVNTVNTVDARRDAGYGSEIRNTLLMYGP
jgi:hypothetical protein